MHKKLILILFSVFSVQLVFGQDIHLTQFFAAPLYLSPALTGSTTDSRFILNHRIQWPEVKHAYSSSLFSFDHNFQRKKSSVGFLATRDNAGTGNLSTSSAGVTYAYKLDFKNNTYVKAGFGYYLYSKSLDYSKLLFQDQIVNGTAISSTIKNTKSKTSYIDFSASMMTYVKKVWFGFTVDHLLNPNNSVTNVDDRLPRKYSVFGGVKFKKNEQLNYMNRNYQVFNFAFLYKKQAMFQQFDLGFYWYGYPIVVGMFFRGMPFLDDLNKPYASTDAISFLIGYKLPKIYVGYNYDYTVSRLTTSTSGTHEIAIIYLLKLNKEKLKVLECPEFF